MDRKAEIIKIRNTGLSYRKIGKLFGVSGQCIHQTLNRKYKAKPFLSFPFGKIGTCGSGRDRIRELVRMRDNYTCQECKKVWEIGQRRFDVHHLDEKYDGMGHSIPTGYDRNNLNKLITLCHKCHFNLDTTRKRLSKALSTV